MSRVTAALLALCITGCAAQAPRPAQSSLACMQAAAAQVPDSLDDKQKHCLASGLIVRYCSVTEAVMAGAGKELRDLFTAGDPSWADLRANREGRRCARDAADDAALASCCAAIPR